MEPAPIPGHVPIPGPAAATRVHIATSLEARHPFKDVAAPGASGAKERPAGSEEVQGKKRQSEAPRVLRAVPLLVPKKDRVSPNLPRVTSEEHHVADGERPRNGQPGPVTGGDQQSARSGTDTASRGACQQQTQDGRSIEQVGNLPKPLCWRHVAMVANIGNGAASSGQPLLSTRLGRSASRTESGAPCPLLFCRDLHRRRRTACQCRD